MRSPLRGAPIALQNAGRDALPETPPPPSGSRRIVLNYELGNVALRSAMIEFNFAGLNHTDHEKPVLELPLACNTNGAAPNREFKKIDKIPRRF